MNTEEHLSDSLKNICSEVKNLLFDAVGFRSLMGDGSNRFNFHQEERSTVKACNTMAAYITVCISDLPLADSFYLPTDLVLEARSNVIKLIEEKMFGNELWMECTKFLLQQLIVSTRIASSVFDIPLVKYLVFRNFSLDKGLYAANSITKAFSHAEYILKVSIGYGILNGLDSGEDETKYIQTMYQNSHLFQGLISCHSLLSSVAKTETKEPIFFDHSNYLTIGGQKITIEAIRKFVSREIRKCLDKMEWILKGFKLLDIPKNMKDDARDKRVGISLLTQNLSTLINPGNVLNSEWKRLVGHLAKQHNLIISGATNSEAIFNLYDNHFVDIGLDILLLIHITGGSPGRKTELALARISNDQQNTRNIFIDGDSLYYAQSYLKTSQQFEKWRPIYRQGKVLNIQKNDLFS